ncbi:MAG: putative metallopeptidase [Bacteroidota bacterium]
MFAKSKINQTLVVALCFSVWSVVLQGCSDAETDAFVDSDLQEYFERFEVEAASRGIVIDLTAAEIEGYIDNIANPNVAGQCTHNSHQPDRVTIDQNYWSRYSDLEKEFLVFHELGHCYLDRGHLDAVYLNGTCVSMMNSGTVPCRSNYNVRTRADYLDELFE